MLCIDDMIRIVKTLPRQSRGEQGNVRLFKGHVSPHELMTAVSVASEKR